MKYPNITLGRVEAVWNKLGGMEGVERFLRGELVVSESARSWWEQDDVISFSATSDGTTGKEWIPRLESKGFRVSNYAKSLLLSPDFKPTFGVIYEIAILKGSLFEDRERITSKIRAEAKRRNMATPNAEITCLIRDKFTDKEIEAMGFWWVIVMHEPIKDSDGDPGFLGAHRNDDGRCLDAYYGHPGHRWNRGFGFAFVASQVGS